MIRNVIDVLSYTIQWSQQNHLGVELTYVNVSMCFGGWGVRDVSSIKKELCQNEYFSLFNLA